MKPALLGEGQSRYDWCDKASLLAALGKLAESIVEGGGFTCTLLLGSAEERIAVRYGVVQPTCLP